MNPTRRTASAVWIVILCILLVAVSALAFVLVNRDWKAKDEIAALQSEIETLQAQSEQAQAAIDAMIPLQEENEDLLAENDRLNDLLKTTEKKLADVQDDLAVAEQEKKRLATENETLSGEAIRLTEELRVANESLAKERDTVISLNKEVSQLKAAIEEAYQRINNAQDYLE